MRRILRSRITWAVLVIVAVVGIFFGLRGGSGPTHLSLGQYEKYLGDDGKVATASIHDDSDTITGKLADGTKYTVSYPDRLTPQLTDKVLAAVPDANVSHSHSNPWLDFALSYLPIIILVAAFFFLTTSMQGGGARITQFGRTKAKALDKDRPKVTFADVAGADEAVAELQEIKEYLEAPSRYQALGAKIPKGVLLFGPPGTGKTLLARAVAGEAGVPFYSISGSDFVEMFVGVGASRVRDLFAQAKASAPAIVFVDEIDAVGRHRGAGMGGGHDEREQTLNQLLVEMDGFDAHGGVILIAATNRPDILDPALLRPGRFDRQIVVDRPDLAGRNRILEVHAADKPLAPGVELDVLAKRTPGFSGADLANLLNEAALLTARRNLRQIGMRECEEAIDRVLAGPERKTLVMSDQDKLVTAYHEAGHAIVGHVLTHADPIHKVSIVARSRSLGLTFTLPDDKLNHTRSELRDTMAMCLGGRTAEEIVFSEPTTGAENDIEKATGIARAMVTEYGMSDVLGPQALSSQSGEVFLGRDYGTHGSLSQDVAAAVDAEVRGLIDEAHERARLILSHHRPTLDAVAQALVEKETLDNLELMAIIGELDPWPVSTTRRPAARPSQPSRSGSARSAAGRLTAGTPARRTTTSAPGSVARRGRSASDAARDDSTAPAPKSPATPAGGRRGTAARRTRSTDTSAESTSSSGRRSATSGGTAGGSPPRRTKDIAADAAPTTRPESGPARAPRSRPKPSEP